MAEWTGPVGEDINLEFAGVFLFIFLGSIAAVFVLGEDAFIITTGAVVSLVLIAALTYDMVRRWRRPVWRCLRATCDLDDATAALEAALGDDGLEFERDGDTLRLGDGTFVTFLGRAVFVGPVDDRAGVERLKGLVDGVLG